MIQLKHVCKSFGNRKLFQDVNLEISDGEFVCFSGPSGCGKTTLLNMIGGLESVDSGDIIVNDKNIRKKKDCLAFYREDAGFIFQNFALVERKTVRENLDMIDAASRTAYSIEEALAFVGLKDCQNKKVYMLSGGEQQRVAIARLLLKKCNLILADEPTGSLDRGNVNKIIELLKQLNEMGKTIILVTHSEDVRAAAKRVIPIASLTEPETSDV